MSEFDFLRLYIESIPETERICYMHGCVEYGYILQEGKEASDIERLVQEVGIVIPEELKLFYRFSYGALLNEYEVLTVADIAELIPRLRWTYEEDWRDSILPFAHQRDLGNFIAFDLKEQNDEGIYLILDGFHEYGPSGWDGICFGLRTWLHKMVESHFRPFWFGESSNID